MPIEASLTRPSMKLILLLPLALFGCSDYPASEGNDSEANPIEIHINIDTQNNLTDPPDNDSMEVDVDSNSDSNSDSDSSSDSSSESTIDNSTGIQVYEFNSIL
jgi:hypothetical protein